MNFQTMNIRIFEKKPVPGILFQPRIEPWYYWHKLFNQLPEPYAYQEIPELFDALSCSMRYIHYYTGIPDPVRIVYNAKVKIKERKEGDKKIILFQTPFGDLSETCKLTVDQTWRTIEFAVKTIDDMKSLTWLYENTRFHFDSQDFHKGSIYIGDRGIPQFWVPKSPYQALAQIWMKLPNLIYSLADYPKAVETTMKAIDAAYDPLYEEITSSGLVRIVNFGENIHEQLLSPKYFQEYLLPFWQKRTDQLHQSGIFSHVHIDGYFKNLLPLVKTLPFDGIEALTPLPQGDMSLVEIKEHIGEKILLDGIPAVLFLDTYSREQLLETTEQIIQLFSPNLILGISDELPEGSGTEAIERVALISDYCKSLVSVA